ncbi:MAG TPA: NAD(P)-dependent oxidoreductase [Gaiellaceae bacterium]|nr:NAD(P)-dependent oxidoreductase [Gaiellaceae bacterium]HUJ56846.1 NAD(P)-dependent oxidoreductase [Gaiellaceae bacterium]
MRSRPRLNRTPTGRSRAMTTVAVLGTGTMGEPIARNLLRAGFDVRVWNRTREKAEQLAADGATVFDAAAEATRGAELVLTILADADSTAETVEKLEFDGGAVWVQSATTGVDGAERLAELAREKGVEFVDAPVLGTRKPAEDAKLVVLASGPDDALERAQPLFNAIGQETRRLGPAPNGSKLKMVTNLWLLAVTEGAAEAIALAEGLGLDPREFLATMKGSQIDTPYLHLKGEAMLERRLAPSFKLKHAEKDASLVLEAAQRAGVDVRVARAVREAFERGIDLGHGDEDMAAVYFAAKPGQPQPPQIP